MSNCFCIPFHVEGIPISEDEQRCMREAVQHNSAVQSTSVAMPPTQLDPGPSLLPAPLLQPHDSARRARVHRSPAASSANGNLLLKQAIANRLKPSPTEPQKAFIKNGDLLSVDEEKRDEMNKSLLMNSAWYRDEDGRTGIKPRGWENLPNIQKEVVKKRKSRKERDEGVRRTGNGLEEGTRSEKLPTRSNIEVSPVSSRKSTESNDKTSLEEHHRKHKHGHHKGEQIREQKNSKSPEMSPQQSHRKPSCSSDLQHLEEALSSLENISTDRKLSKDEKKLLKQQKKELKKIEEELKKEERKREDELRKEEKKQKKEEKRREKDEKKRERSSSATRQPSTPDSEVRSSESISSELSQNTVKENDSPRMTSKPPKPRSGRTVSASAKPKKEDIGDRRDSNMSESSRISGRSVTFSERIQFHQFERDSPPTSDEETTPQPQDRSRFVKFLQDQKFDSDEEFEEQERMIAEQQQLVAGYPVYDLESSSLSIDDEHSQHSPEDEEHAWQVAKDILDDENSYISLDRLPNSILRAIAAEVGLETYGGGGGGDMSRLHGEDSHSPSLLAFQQLPRSASGYLETDPGMVESYQQALYGTVFNGQYEPQPGPSQPSHRSTPSSSAVRQLQESYYDNVHGRPPSQTTSLLDVHSKESTPVPSPPRRGSSTSIDRALFFEPDREITPTPLPPAPKRGVLISNTTTASTTLTRTELIEKIEKGKNEDAMRRRFLEKFGSRRAPMAEEDPSDPVPSGSQESIASTNSRESVVSAASVSTESTVRRHFNY